MQHAVPTSELSNRAGIGALLWTRLSVALLGFVPDLMSSAVRAESNAWRVSIFLFAIAHLSCLYGTVRGRARILRSDSGAAGLPPTPMQVVAFPVGFLVCILQLLRAAGFLGERLFFAYLLEMLWMLAIARWMFRDRLLDGFSNDPAA